ncbi:hypothetical protein [Levilactobacillus sp. N40-8-2]|uniref:hypothetical protein n=1 Tax=Levilactobacillus muriae TaxID=3238987 RepID=UPI0038B3011D
MTTKYAYLNKNLPATDQTPSAKISEQSVVPDMTPPKSRKNNVIAFPLDVTKFALDPAVAPAVYYDIQEGHAYTDPAQMNDHRFDFVRDVVSKLDPASRDNGFLLAGGVLINLDTGGCMYPQSLAHMRDDRA